MPIEDRIQSSYKTTQLSNLGTDDKINNTIADSNAGPWLVSGSKLYRGFSWGSGARALVIENQDGTLRISFGTGLSWQC